jgi:hypothetical protein
MDKSLQKLKLNLNHGFTVTNLNILISNPKFLNCCWDSIKTSFVTQPNKCTKISDKTKELLVTEMTAKLKNGLFCFDSILKFDTNLLLLKNQIVQKGILTILKIVYAPVIQKYSDELKQSYHQYKLKEIKKKLKIASWYIKGTIEKRFLVVNYHVLIKLISIKIKDQMFINLTDKYFKVKFEKNKFSNSFIKINIYEKDELINVLLSIYLCHIDNYIKSQLNLKISLKKNKFVLLKKCLNYKIFYFRYKLDFIISLEGNKEICFDLKYFIQKFFYEELKLLVNKNKINVISPSDCYIELLGFELLTSNYHKANTESFANTKNNNIRINASEKKIFKDLKDKGYIKRNNRPRSNKKLIHYDLDQIVNYYKMLEKTLFKYYFHADNFKYLYFKIRFVLKKSCALTIASKMKLNSIKKVFRKYGKNLSTQIGNTTVSYE